MATKREQLLEKIFDKLKKKDQKLASGRVLTTPNHILMRSAEAKAKAMGHSVHKMEVGKDRSHVIVHTNRGRHKWDTSSGHYVSESGHGIQGFMDFVLNEKCGPKMKKKEKGEKSEKGEKED